MSLERPNWNDRQDRKLYEDLFYTKYPKKLTEKEQQFVTTMYHYEEYSCGLDGD